MKSALRRLPPKPMAFTAFCGEVLKVTLTPGQRVLCLIAYDGLEPKDLRGQDRELARQIFGDVDVIPPEARAVVVAVCGARGGKSYVLCALRLLYLALTVPLTTLAPGEVATGLIVAPDMRLARQTLRYALGAAKRVPSIASRIRSESSDGFVIEREGGQMVSIEALPATRGGSALRGRTLVAAVLDEAAFFRDQDYTVNDTEVFKAVAPRVLPEGQVILGSTPWAEGMGLLYELFSDNHGAPRTALAAHAPTLLLRDDHRTRSIVEREQERDPDNAAREFGAQFMSAGSGLFFDPHAVDRSVDETLVLPQPYDIRTVVAVGADFGFKSDSSAIIVASFDGETYRVVELLELRPQRGKPLQPSVVVAAFADATRPYHATSIIADRHYEEALREHLSAQGLTLLAAADGQSGKVETYSRARALIHQGVVRLPKHGRLLAQLKAVVSKPTPGGGLAISSPRKANNGHGDLLSALVLALAALPATHHEPWMQNLIAPPHVRALTFAA